MELLRPFCLIPHRVTVDVGVKFHPHHGEHRRVGWRGFPNQCCYSDRYSLLFPTASARSWQKDFLNGRMRDLLALDFVFLWSTCRNCLLGLGGMTSSGRLSSVLSLCISTPRMLSWREAWAWFGLNDQLQCCLPLLHCEYRRCATQDTALRARVTSVRTIKLVL